MAENTVTIGCKLPGGLVIEVGYKVEATGADGKKFTKLQKTDKYRRVVLKGWHSGVPDGVIVLANHQPKPGITRGVPKEVWDEWVKEPSHASLVEQGIVFVATNEADLQAKILDARKAKSGLEAREGDKLVQGVERADFQKSPATVAA